LKDKKIEVKASKIACSEQKIPPTKYILMEERTKEIKIDFSKQV